MNTGVVVQVPLFISIGEKVKVDTTHQRIRRSNLIAAYCVILRR